MIIFIIYIGIVGPLFHSNYALTLRFHLVIKIINFTGIQKWAYLAMLINFHVSITYLLEKFIF
jgi:hypothetical protein